MNLSLLVVILAINGLSTSAQQQCEDLQYLNTTSNECLALPDGKSSKKILDYFYTLIDFTILLNQTTYTAKVDHSLALTGIPLVRYTVFISEAITSASPINAWTSTLSSIGGSPTNFFTPSALNHPFPPSFTPPLADSDTIAVAAGSEPPPGNYSYNLQVATVAIVNGIPIVVSYSSGVIIQLIATPGKNISIVMDRQF